MNGATQDYIRKLEGQLEEARDVANAAIAESERLRAVLEAITDVLIAFKEAEERKP